jgi:hypothetical protein
MELSALFPLLAVILLVMYFVSRPLFSRTRSVRRDDPTQSHLLAERDRVLSAIQELDFDHTLGKIPAGDYPSQREMLVQKGAEILRKLDDLEGSSRKTHQVPARIHSASFDDDIEDLVARRRAGKAGKTGGFCPKCGKPILQSDRYCPKCGWDVKAKRGRS